MVIIIIEIIVFALITYGVIMIAYGKSPIPKVQKPLINNTIPNTAIKNAIKIANDYLSIEVYSKKGLIEELYLREKIDKKTARKAVNSLDVDWQEQLNIMLTKIILPHGYSEKETREALISNGFPKKDINKILRETDIDWVKQAKLRYSLYKKMGYSEKKIEERLNENGFAEEIIRNAVK